MRLAFAREEALPSPSAPSSLDSRATRDASDYSPFAIQLALHKINCRQRQQRQTSALEHRLRPGKLEIIYNLAQLRSASGRLRPSSFDGCRRTRAMNWPDPLPGF